MYIILIINKYKLLFEYNWKTLKCDKIGLGDYGV